MFIQQIRQDVATVREAHLCGLRVDLMQWRAWREAFKAACGLVWVGFKMMGCFMPWDLLRLLWRKRK